jgi:hypothetical protein
MRSVKTGTCVPSRKLIFGSLMSLYLVWGSSYVAFKLTFETLPPLLSTGACFGLAGAALVAYGCAAAPGPARATSSAAPCSGP